MTQADNVPAGHGGPAGFAAALAADAALPAQRTSSSHHLGWTSALVRTYREDATTDPVDLAPVAHPALVMVTGGVYQVHSRSSGRWRDAVYRPGSIGLTPPGRGNTLRWRTLGPEPLTSVHVHLAAAVWDEFAARAAAPRPAPGFPNRLDDGDPLVAALLRALHGAAETGAPALYVDATVQLLCAHLVLRPAGGAGPRVPVRGLSARALGDVVEYMEQHLGDDVTLDALAEAARLSKYHFLRQFSAGTGTTPIAYLTQLRMERAAVLLVRHRRSSAWTAHACGYGSPSRFSAAFRRHHGVSPARYRDDR